MYHGHGNVMLVDCSKCRVPLILMPPEASSIICTLCQRITRIANPREVPPPSAHDYINNPAPSQQSSLLSPFNHAPPGPYPSPHGPKKAVICGISYRNSQRNELKGCINDANCMRHLLISRFNFPESSILMLTEDETDPSRLPTKQNLRRALHWLVQGVQSGDSLLFHFSGHGSRQRDFNGDEVDGYDETLCPMDFETHGMIVDNEINHTIVKPLPRGAKLHAIIDSCHSGTILDLPFLCKMGSSEQYIWEDHCPPNGDWKGTDGGEAISFSGCNDDQTSAESSALSRITSTGAMTFCFIQAIERGEGATYGSILTSMRNTIRSIDCYELGSGGCRGLRQEPQLTSIDPFDPYTKEFSL